MECSRCNTECSDDQKFCPECGKKLPKPKPESQANELIDQVIIAKVDPVLTVKEVAKLLKISEWMVYELIRQGKIPYFIVGNRKRFRTDEVLKWAANQDLITTAG